MADDPIEPGRDNPARRDGGGFRPWTPLERSLLPSLVLTAGVLIGLMLLRLRLPPLPYSLVILLLLWLGCFVATYMWQARRRR